MANDDSAQLLRRTNPRRNTTKYYTQIYAPSRDNTSFNTSQYLMNSLIYPHNKAKTNPNPNSQYSDQTKETPFSSFHHNKNGLSCSKNTPRRHANTLVRHRNGRGVTKIKPISGGCSDKAAVERHQGCDTSTSRLNNNNNTIAVVPMRTATVHEL